LKVFLFPFRLLGTIAVRLGWLPPGVSLGTSPGCLPGGPPLGGMPRAGGLPPRGSNVGRYAG
jgi:hypothetical protein